MVTRVGEEALLLVLLPLLLSAETLALDVSKFSSSSTTQKQMNGSRTFAIDYTFNTFVMDEKPFRFVSGSIHYFRSPRQYWRRLLFALKAGGFNTVSTYVEWSFHEPERKSYSWSGDKDLVYFINLAQEEGLFVILRPGPYICAERDMGGLPYWLLNYPNIKLRTNNEVYKAAVVEWYSQLMRKMQPLLYGNGGPIIMVQVENEYGSFPACDHHYMEWLAALTEYWTRGAALLFTTDGPSAAFLRCGSTPRAYATIDFDVGQNVEKAWEKMRQVSPQGPLVNMELYTGWISHWGEPLGSVNSSSLARTLDTLLASGANVNVYMFHGGTNFGFTSGANFDSTYRPSITSYDYDAPLSEAGKPTPKYTVISKVVQKYLPVSNMSLAKMARMKLLTRGLGPQELRPVVALLGHAGRTLLGTTPRASLQPQQQTAALMLYETQLPGRSRDPLELSAPGLADRALAYLNLTLVGVLSRSRNLTKLALLSQQGDYLSLLVENQGRINYGKLISELKGINGNVTLDGRLVWNWTMTSFPLNSVADLAKRRGDLLGVGGQRAATRGLLRSGPVVYEATFCMPEGSEEEQPGTYLDVTGWGKGVAYVNDINLGRYWPNEGPQISLYIPGAYLRAPPAENHLVLLELQHAPADCVVHLSGSPKFRYISDDG